MNKAELQSEVYSSELNCLAVVREGTKLVVGSGEGSLILFNQGQWGYHRYIPILSFSRVLWNYKKKSLTKPRLLKSIFQLVKFC